MIIITDTTSDIFESEAKEMNIRMVTVSSTLNEVVFNHNTKEVFNQFYEAIAASDDVPVSSQPAPNEYIEIYEEAKRNNEDVLVLSVSSLLSGTYNGALLAKDICGYENIYVVDSMLASAALRLFVMKAVRLRDEGKSAKEIVEILEVEKEKYVLAGIPETMLYLKKGGRVSPVLANIGDKFKIKPVLILKDGIVQKLGTARGMNGAKKQLMNLLKENTLDPSFPVLFGHSHNEEKGVSFMNDEKDNVGGLPTSIFEVGPAIGTHIGPHALLIAFKTL